MRRVFQVESWGKAKMLDRGKIEKKNIEDIITEANEML